MTRTLRWVGLLAFLGINCTRIDRRPNTLVAGDFTYGEAVAAQHGCGGEISRQIHRQWSSGLALRHETEDGLVLGGRIRRLVGSLYRYEVTDPEAQLEYGDNPPVEDPHYDFWSSGVTLGYHRKEAGAEAGITTVFGDGVSVWPWGRLLAGDLQEIWFEGTVGAEDPLYLASWGSIAAGFRTEVVRGRIGAVAYGHLIDDATLAGTDVNRGLASNLFDLGLFADLMIQAGPVGIVLGGLLGEGPTGRIGLSYLFE